MTTNELLDPAHGVLDGAGREEKECMLCKNGLFRYDNERDHYSDKHIKFSSGNEICYSCGATLHSHFFKKFELEFFYKRLNSIEKQLQDYALGMQRLYDSIQEVKNGYINGNETKGSNDEKDCAEREKIAYEG